MLFSSIEFLFFFLPIVLIGYLLLRKTTGQKYIYIWLSVTSLFFYCWWDIALSWLIFCSLGFNFLLGRQLIQQTNLQRNTRKLLTIAGIIANLTPLFYYKYSSLFIENIGVIIGVDLTLNNIILPLGISFFTFQQITYIIDAYKGQASVYTFFHYATFVTFFPQLIAGPIVHHGEMMSQFDTKTKRIMSLSENLGIGLGIFAIGIFKKVVIADSLGALASPVFFDARSGGIEMVAAWTGALAYTFQLYFDFSGYSDMAIGLARMFGIKLPANFNSPYKATSIIDFWRRWHMTLSRFLRDYIYIPLGGNRKGHLRRHFNLMLTMLIGGVWHGAGWTFLFWGALHGVYLVLNHMWSSLFPRQANGWGSHIRTLASWFLTFFAVVVGWVFFRADSFSSAINIFGGMIGLHGIELPRAIFSFLSGFKWIDLVPVGGENFVRTVGWIILSTALAFIPKNTIQIFAAFCPVLDQYPLSNQQSKFLFRPSATWAFFVAILLYVSITQILGSKSSEFLYFNF